MVSEPHSALSLTAQRQRLESTSEQAAGITPPLVGPAAAGSARWIARGIELESDQ